MRLALWLSLGTALGLRHRTFPVGSHVLISGLQHEVELNGREAVVEGFDSEEKRYVVRLPSELYRKVLAEHLRLKEETPCGRGPLSLEPGSQLLVAGMTSATRMNGQRVSVRCYNGLTGRYVVQLADGTLRAVTPEHLRPEVTASVEEELEEHLAPGMRATLVGLKNAAMNGKVVQVKSYDRHRKRYVVRLADGTLRRVQAKRLRATEATARPRLSLCSAWKKTLKVVLTDDTSSKALGSLDFQACEDIEELPFEKGFVRFLSGSQELLRAPFDLAAGALQLTAAPADSGELRVHSSQLQEDGGAFFLNLIDGRGSERPAKLMVQRGQVAKLLPLDKTYRLERVEDMRLSLTLGSRQLKMAFWPQKAKTYSAIVTGGDGRDGLVLHKLGEWTSAELLEDH